MLKSPVANRERKTVVSPNTQNIVNHFKSILKGILSNLSVRSGISIDLDKVVIELPKEKKFGDLATNAAMVYCKNFGMSPVQLGELIKSELDKYSEVRDSSMAGPGFLNWFLCPSFVVSYLPMIVEMGFEYGKSSFGCGEKVNVEYVSANPTGPMHAGHARGAVIGDVFASLMSYAGFDVTREYYINDAGNQVNILAKTLRHRYLERLKVECSPLPDNYYPGEYIYDTADKLISRDSDKWIDSEEEEWLPVFMDFVLEDMMLLIKEDLNLLGVHHDVFVSERALVGGGKVEEALAVLEAKGLIYEGVLEAPKGKKIDDWEPRSQTLFKSTLFGDDVDRPFKKSDGTWTYFATDIAYHLDKISRGFTSLVDFWGADHGGYIKRMKAAVKALDENVHFDARICQLVKFMQNGEELKMSKRAGTFVAAKDVLEKVGKDVTRFIMLTRRDDAPLDFDFQKVVEMSRENPVFYVHYAHARSHSAIKQAKEAFPNISFDDDELLSANIDLLKSDAEIKMLKVLLMWPNSIEAAAKSREPHRIAFYLQDVASEFHSFWNAGKEDPSLRFVLPNDIDKTKVRIALVRAVAIIISSGLQIMGIEAMKEL